jgi:hypothetical protein
MALLALGGLRYRPLAGLDDEVPDSLTTTSSAHLRSQVGRQVARVLDAPGLAPAIKQQLVGIAYAVRLAGS